MEICELKKDDEKAWDEYVLKSDSSTFYHQIGWKNVIEKTYGHKPYYLIALEEGEIRGILPLFLMKSIFFGKKLVSVPFAPYGGVCGDNEVISGALIKEAKRITERLGADYLELRHLCENGKELVTNEAYVTLILELEEDPEVIWKRFNNKMRNAIRKGIKSNLKVTIEDGNEEIVKRFYQVYTKNMRDLGTPPHSLIFFKNTSLEFFKKTKIAIVQHEEKDIAVLFLLYFNDIIISGWAASDRNYLKLNPNNIMYWETIKSGCEDRYRYFDFGRSITDQGTFRFKKPWGAEPKTLNYQYFLNKKCEMPDISTSNPNRQSFAKVWKKLPVPLTKIMGSKLRRNFP